MKKLKIGISIGDINGIGLEVILKTLADTRVKNLCIPIIYGSSKIVAYHKNIANIEDFSFQSLKSAERVHNEKVNVVNCWQENINIQLGKVSEEGGKYAFESLSAATTDLKNGLIDALVTAPINKKSMQLSGFPFPGHTEYLTKELGDKQSLMLMINDTLRIGLATNHIPVKDIATTITKELIIKKLRSFEETLRMDFGIDKPNIAVLALNPHASDDGVIGEEEGKIIRPAIVECKKRGMMALGPFPADGFFGSGLYAKYDGILAMYHDQGLIPFKTLSFGNGVNFTAGLSGVRTSPDHGTGFDLAGQNIANPDSFRSALFAAIDICRNRNSFLESHENTLVKKGRRSEIETEGNPKDLVQN